jgi:predicted enzyme related to lactoylglutathione lyase
MSGRTSYVPGTPCWVDLGTPDIEAAASFYGGLFGWEIPELPNSAELGGYRRAKKDGADVGGVMPLMQEGEPPAWRTYVAVADADATAAAVRDAGGTVIVEPMDVMELGRMAIFVDPQGALFGIWQPGTFVGAAHVNEPGAVGWNELATRDPDAAKTFYNAVFGWGVEEQDIPDGGTYYEWRLGEETVGGMLDMRGRIPDEVPTHWLTYFGCEDADAALERVEQLGGSLLFGPMDVSAGRFAVVGDPFGARFAVMRPSEETLERMAKGGD